MDDARFLVIERRMWSMRREIDNLGADMNELRGVVEQLSYEIDTLKKELQRVEQALYDVRAQAEVLSEMLENLKKEGDE